MRALISEAEDQLNILQTHPTPKEVARDHQVRAETHKLRHSREALEQWRGSDTNQEDRFRANILDSEKKLQTLTNAPIGPEEAARFWTMNNLTSKLRVLRGDLRSLNDSDVQVPPRAPFKVEGASTSNGSLAKEDSGALMSQGKRRQGSNLSPQDLKEVARKWSVNPSDLARWRDADGMRWNGDTSRYAGAGGIKDPRRKQDQM